MPARPGPLVDRRDVAAGLGLLTRLPVKVNPAFAMARGAAAAWAFPLAGLAVAGLAALPGAGLLWLGTGPGVAAGMVLALQVLITGALHEDGLADCCDGFWGGWTRARRLEIMKDSRIGAYGVLGLVFAMGLGWQALAGLMAQPGWMAWSLSAAMLSRAAMVWVMATRPRARPAGLSARSGRPSLATAGLGLGLSMAAALALTGPVPAAVSGILTLGVAHGLGALARSRIGGQTGDVLGGVQVVTALAVLSAGLVLTAPQ